MWIRKLDPEALVNAYNVDLQLLYPWEGVVTPPFGAAWAILAPGESTKPHAHQECETFFIARGRGVMSIGDDRRPVEAGDVTFHPPFDNHTLTNASDDEDLLFLTVYWEDREAWKGVGEGTEAAASPAAVEVSRVLVTAAPPTPNGDLHLGHLAGPYLSGDFHARYLRLRGLDARFVFGSDDNSPWVAGLAGELGSTPSETARSLSDSIAATLSAAGVELAAYTRANRSGAHREAVQEVFRELHHRGAIVEKEVTEAYCEACDRVLVENSVEGRCPHCRQAMAGNTCEACGWATRGGELLEARCRACGADAVIRRRERLVFPLAPHAERLRELYRHVEMPTRLRAFCQEALAGELPDFPVTQPGDWGLEVPVPGHEDERIYVWFEIAPRYLGYARHLAAADGAGPAGWERWWKADDARVVQFFGFDNVFYYTVLIPAVLAAYDPEIRLPEALVSNEFYRLDGLKFSTSRNHRILGRDLLAEAPRDAVRFYLASTCPEREETNFTREEFAETCRRELTDGWLAWLADLARRVETAGGGKVPATGDWTGEHRRFFGRLETLLGEIGEAYEAAGFSPQRATRLLGELVREARRFGRGEAHWERAASTHGEERRTALALEVLAAKLLGLAAAPVTPAFSEALWRALGFDRGPGDGDWLTALEWVPAGQDASGLARPLGTELAPEVETAASAPIVVTN